MQQNKLLNSLRQLDSVGMKSLNKFMNSPFFTSSALLKALFEQLWAIHPHYDDAQLLYKRLCRAVFPGEQYTEKKHKQGIQKRMSELLVLVNKFMAVKDFDKMAVPKRRERNKLDSGARPSNKVGSVIGNNVLKELAQDELLQKRLEGRYLAKYAPFDDFEVHQFVCLDFLSSLPERGASYYWERLRILHELYLHPGVDKLTGSAPLFANLMNSLRQFYLFSHLLYASEALNRNHFVEEKLMTDTVFAMDFLQEKETKSPAFEIYSNIVKLIGQTRDIMLFKTAKTTFLDNASYLGKDELGVLFSCLLNYAIRVHRSGNESLLGDMLELYCFGLVEGILLENGKLSDSTLFNMVVTATLAEEHVFVEAIIEGYGDFVEERLRENTLTICKAFNAFHRGDWKNAKTLIGNTRFLTLRHKLLARPVELRCLYEQFVEDGSVADTLYAAIQAFKKFIKRSRTLNESYQLPYLNFANVLAEMAKNKGRKDFKEHILILIDKMSGEVIAKQWIEKRIGVK